MNRDLEIIHRKIKLMENAQNDVSSAMESVFPPGSKIVFKKSNMKYTAPASIYYTQIFNGHAYLKVMNLKTGRDVKISIDDVVAGGRLQRRE